MATRLRIPDPEKAKEYFQDKTAYTLGPVEVDFFRKQGDTFNLIDVRDAEDYIEEHPKGALSLPQNQWDTFKGLSREKLNVVFCYDEDCHLAAKAALKFASGGYPVMEMNGGFESWKEHELETEKGEAREKVA